jgi:hypothetical protein
MSAAPEAFVVNSTAGNSAPFGGRRRSGKKMRLVRKKTVRRMLKKMGLRMRGGASDMVASGPTADKMGAVADAADPATPVTPGAATAGARRRSSKRTRRGRSKRGIFGMRY